MKNQLAVLTEKEKIDFLVKLKEKQKLGWLNKKEFSKRFFRMYTVFATSLTAICTIIAFFNPSFIGVTFIVGLIAGSFWVCEFNMINHENKMLLDISNGKINRKKFFKLVKSGQIQKWQEMFKEQIENIRLEKLNIKVNDYIKDLITTTLKENPNAKLDAEKLANSIKNIAKSNEQKQTTTPSQNVYIHECPAVKKMFELVEDDENIDTLMNKISFDAYEK